MPIKVRRIHLPVQIDRATVLNPTLSPPARLLYVVLSAIPEGDPTEPAYALAGIPEGQEQPYLEELRSIGAIDILQHRGEGEATVTVNELPAGTRVHECIPCTSCGACACYVGGGNERFCNPCRHRDDTRREASADIARYKRQLEAGATYAIGSNGSRLHRWDCPTMNNPDRSLRTLRETEEEEGPSLPGYWGRLPELFTAEQLRKRRSVPRSCATCGPDPI